jgi:hypothetical protein
VRTAESGGSEEGIEAATHGGTGNAHQILKPWPSPRRISQFCERQVPDDMRDQVRVEHRVRGRTVTLVEHRPPWNPALGIEWTDTPQARMKYDEQTGGWTLYWFDRNSRAHAYDLLEPDQPIERLLAEYDDDPTCIFKG